MCGDCSKHRYMIPTQSDEPLRVCNKCYALLTNNLTEIKSKEVSFFIRKNPL